MQYPQVPQIYRYALIWQFFPVSFYSNVPVHSCVDSGHDQFMTERARVLFISVHSVIAE